MFKIHSEYQPTGDQSKAIEYKLRELVENSKRLCRLSCEKMMRKIKVVF